MPAPLGLPDHASVARAASPGGPFRLQVRPLTRDDRERLAEAFSRLSPRTRYLRFHAPKPRLSAAELTYFTDIDHVTHEALAAVDSADGRLVGVARYAPIPGQSGTADFAIVVADEWQGKGVGRWLARELVGRARANGVETLSATTLEENRVARTLLRAVGFKTRAFGGGVVELELDLAVPR